LRLLTASTRWAYGHGLRLGLGRGLVFLARRLSVWREVPVPMDDGRHLVLDLREPQNLPYLLYGRAPYEAGEERVVRALVQPGEQVIDVGANVGWYSTMLADLVGPTGAVYAFEPNLTLIHNLELTAAAYPALRVLAAAVGEAEGNGLLRLSRLLGNSSLESNVPEQTGCQECRIVTLDAFLASVGNPPVTFIKSDTEGGELRVLRGARRVLGGALPPACLVEFNPHYGLDPMTLLGFFNGLQQGGYSAWKVDPLGGTLVPPEFGAEVINCLFVPDWLTPRITRLMRPQPNASRLAIPDEKTRPASR